MSENSLHQAIHENFLASIDRVGFISERSAVERIGPWLLVDTGEARFRGADSASAVFSATKEDLDTAMDWFAARGARPRFRLREPHDDHLIANLKALGFEAEESEPALHAAAVSPSPYEGSLSISAVENDQDLERYGLVNWSEELRHIGFAIARTARAKQFDLLLGCLDGAPIACSMAATTGDLVGVDDVAVQEPYRLRGFGEALTWAAVAARQRRGAKNAWLGASVMGLPLYETMGFRRQFAYHHLARSVGDP